MGFTGAYVLFCFRLLHKEQGRLADPSLITVVCALTGIGLAALTRIDPALGTRQFLWLMVGLMAFCFVAHLGLWELIQRMKYLLGVGALILLAITWLFGVEINGAKAWIRLGNVLIQPVEGVKVLLALFFACYLAENRSRLQVERHRILGASPARQGPMMVVATAAILILSIQRDLGSAALISGVWALSLFAVTGSKRLLGVMTFVGALGLTSATQFFPHALLRLRVWIDPFSDRFDSGYQTVEGLFALAAGGLWGTGWGRGMATRIPAVESDFIFALISEEMGLFGAAGLVGLVSFLCFRAVTWARTIDHDDVQRIASLTFGLFFALQSILIIGGITRLLPLTGVTLPFVSHGGSSLIASFVKAGLLYNVAYRYTGVAHRPKDAGGPKSKWKEA